MEKLVLPIMSNALEKERRENLETGDDVILPYGSGRVKDSSTDDDSSGGVSSCGLINDELIKLFMANGLLASGNFGRQLNVELLKLSTLLIEFKGRALVDHRKELIKFAWGHLKCPHATCKQHAYVNVSR